MELVVRTPNVIGTAVSADAAVSPCATAAAMKSKCGVAPRPGSRAHDSVKSTRARASLAAAGSSNAPGTRTIVMSSVAAPAASSAATAPDWRRSVTKS
jgi:hypothetical protein